MMLDWFQKDQPLGLPKGSVRAVMGLGIIGSTIGALFVFGPEAAKTWMALAGPVLAVYFIARNGQRET